MTSRRQLLLLGVPLATSLACGGASYFLSPLPDGEVVLANVHGDGCAQWSGDAIVPRHGRSWTLRIEDERGYLTTFEVPRNAERVPIRGQSEANRQITLTPLLGISRPISLKMPPVTVAARLEPNQKLPPFGDVPPQTVQVIADCPGDRLSILASMSDIPLSIRPLDDALRTTFDVPLGTFDGRHAVTLTVLGADGPLSTRTDTLIIGPPCVDVDGDGVQACDGDCNDSDPSIHPGQKDVPGDGVDSDCDGVNGQDADGDGAESSDVGGTDCDDGDPRVFGGQISAPDLDGDGAYAWENLDWNCDGESTAAPGPFDCDDQNPAVPTDELPDPNGVDDDCDGIIDEGTVAYDDDGDGQTELAGDCNDADATVFLDATELPDCKDNDCDFDVDEGVARARRDDRFEPNDTQSYALSGAVKKRQFLGIDTGYKPTYARLDLVSRDHRDLEQFSVWTHDGNVDSWHVTIRAESIGDGQRYDVVIEGEGDGTRGRLDGPGSSVSLFGSGGDDNSGTYVISVRGVDGNLDYCPISVAISSG